MSGFKPFVVMLLGLGTLGSIGCADGPFYRMWYRKEWEADEKYGATFHTKLNDLDELRDGVEALSVNEQTRMATEINNVIGSDPSPLYRAKLVRTLAKFDTPVALEGMRIAIQDEDPTVRIAACEAWRNKGNEEAVRILSNVIGSDTDTDVRMAATRELGEFNRQDAVQALGLALNDSDPALQHRAVQSLKTATGRDIGDDVPAWQEYVQNGGTVSRDAPSVAEQLRRSIF